MCLIYSGYEMLEIRFWQDSIFKKVTRINIITIAKGRSIKIGNIHLF